MLHILFKNDVYLKRKWKKFFFFFVEIKFPLFCQ